MNVLVRLLGYIGRDKGRLAVAVLLSFCGVLIELARPWTIKIVVDYALSNRPIPSALMTVRQQLPGAGSAEGLIVWSVIAAVLITVCGSLLGIATMWATTEVAQKLVFDLSLDLFAKLQRLSLTYHGKHAVADLLQRVSNDAFIVYFAVAQVFLPVLISLLTLLGMFAVMVQIDLVLALITLGVVPLLALSLAIFTKPMNDTTARQWARQGSFMAMLEQSLSSIKAVQGFAREALIQQKVRAQAADLARAYKIATYVGTGYNQANTAITGVAAALLLGLGGSRVLNGRLSLGDLLVFLGYLAALYGPVNQLASAVGAAVQIVARGRRVFEVMDSQEQIPERDDATVLKHVRGDIAFEGVSFGYETGEAGTESRPVLRDISFHARPGQVVAIVGATGAGKTTLASLLSRFYDPTAGRILLDGHDLRDLSLQSLRENVSLVLQEPYLFPISVADNIAFGRPDATQEEIIEVAKAAHAHEFIERLPEGYDTLLAEKGISLSGGERQRIAIARALLKDAPILILDEPTSALDARTESFIFEAMSRLIADRTTFIISHRLSTIRRADQILAIENSTIAERGTHESLLEQDEVYARLYRHQYITAM